MKRIIAIILLISLAALGVWAQDEYGATAGQKYIGLNFFSGDMVMQQLQYAPTGFSFGNATSMNDTTVSDNIDWLFLNLNTECGYFIFDGFEIGLVALMFFIMVPIEPLMAGSMKY